LGDWGIRLEVFSQFLHAALMICAQKYAFLKNVFSRDIAA
jgi:hypothetical protein